MVADRGNKMLRYWKEIEKEKSAFEEPEGQFHFYINTPTKVDRNQIVCMPIEIRNIQDDQQVREGIENCIRMTKYSLGIRK